MKLIIIFGPQAVGKMTVGRELEKITDLKLFHNHATIELVSPFFSYATDTGKKLVKTIREELFKAVATSDLAGLIFTYVWYFDVPSDRTYLEELTNIFKEKGADVIFVELEADLEKRIERNKTEYRLEQKPTKRDVEWSETELKNSHEHHRLNSLAGEIEEEHYLRIDNTNLSAQEVAERIKTRFKL